MSKELPKTYDFKNIETSMYQWWWDQGYFKPINDPKSVDHDPDHKQRHQHPGHLVDLPQPPRGDAEDGVGEDTEHDADNEYNNPIFLDSTEITEYSASHYRLFTDRRADYRCDIA